MERSILRFRAGGKDVAFLARRFDRARRSPARGTSGSIRAPPRKPPSRDVCCSKHTSGVAAQPGEARASPS